MKVLILDGSPSNDLTNYNQLLQEISEELSSRKHEVKVFILRDMDIRFCTGCWSCWWATPGECAFKDESHTVCREYIHSDFVLFASPMFMGFTSAVMKKIQDKLIPLVHPYIEFVQGECHHLKRYDVYPKLALLMNKTPDTDDEDVAITSDMFKRFALNLKSEVAFTKLLTAQPAQEVCDAIDRI